MLIAGFFLIIGRLQKAEAAWCTPCGKNCGETPLCYRTYVCNNPSCGDCIAADGKSGSCWTVTNCSSHCAGDPHQCTGPATKCHTRCTCSPCKTVCKNTCPVGGPRTCSSHGTCCNGVVNDTGNCSYCVSFPPGCARVNCSATAPSCCNATAPVKPSSADNNPNCLLHCNNQASVCGGVNVCSNVGCGSSECTLNTDCEKYCKRTTKPCTGKSGCKCKPDGSGGKTQCGKSVCDANLCNNANPDDCSHCAGTSCCCRSSCADSTTCGYCTAPGVKCLTSYNKWGKCCRQNVGHDWGNCSGSAACWKLDKAVCIGSGSCVGQNGQHVHIGENTNKASCFYITGENKCRDSTGCVWYYDWSWIEGSGGCEPFGVDWYNCPGIPPSCYLYYSSCSCTP